MLYQVEQRAENLCALLVMWQSHLAPITPLYPMPTSWGPSQDALLAAETYRFTTSVDEYASYQVPQPPVNHPTASNKEPSEDNESEDGCDDGEECITDLLDLAEAAELADAYHLDDDWSPWVDSFPKQQNTSPRKSPRKRGPLDISSDFHMS